MQGKGWRWFLSVTLPAAAFSAACGSRTAPGGPPDDNPPGPDYSVLEHHNGPSRNGLYVHPSFTRASASAIQLAFSTPIDGLVNAQPLFVDGLGAGSDMVLVATMRNQVYAINARTGAVVWRRALDSPLPRQVLIDGLGPCGSFDPIGISGTPVIDKASRRIYFDLLTPDEQRRAKHLLYALSLDDGHTVAGWPVDVGRSVVGFNALPQHQRGALTLLNGRVYVPYGGYAGDCGDYRGWLVGISTLNPASVTAWSPAAPKAGIWAPNGIASDGTSLYVATGNTDSKETQWRGSEAVFRLQPGPAFTGSSADYFVPLDWPMLDEHDRDLGSSGVTLFDLPGTSPTPVLAALGKDAKLYLISRANLGGINGSLLVDYVSTFPVINAPSVYTNARGTHLVFNGWAHSIDCAGDENLASIRISQTPAFSISTSWCANPAGQATSTIVTTTDGLSESVVWVVGEASRAELYGYDGDSGALIASATLGAAVVARYTAPIAAKGTIFVGGMNRLYAFSIPSQ